MKHLKSYQKIYINLRSSEKFSKQASILIASRQLNSFYEALKCELTH
jgi:hypothetical protein